MRLCPRCQATTARDNWRCSACGALVLRPIAGGANDDGSDDEELPQTVSITFTLRSGEAVEVRDFLDGPLSLPLHAVLGLQSRHSRAERESGGHSQKPPLLP